MKNTILTVLFLICAGSAFAAGAMQRIVLQDRSVIIGRVVEMKEGVYTIVSETVGEIKIAADKILEISAVGSQTSSNDIGIIDGTKKTSSRQASSQPRSLAGSDDLRAQQERANSQVQSMAMQEDFLDQMIDLSESSRMLDVMSDPEVMEAISRNDYEFLMNNEKMKALMESSEIRQLFGE